MDPVELDGVHPPSGQGPTLVVWRPFGNRRDQLRGSALWAGAFLVIGLVIVLANAGLHPDLSGVLVVFGIMFVCWALMHYVAASRKSFHAAGRNWSMTSLGPTAKHTWVRTDELAELTAVRHSAGVSLVMVDRSGRRSSIRTDYLRSSEPLRQLLLAGVQASRLGRTPPEALAALLPPVRQPNGRTVVREGPLQEPAGQQGWGPPAARPS